MVLINGRENSRQCNEVRIGRDTTRIGVNCDGMSQHDGTYPQEFWGLVAPSKIRTIFEGTSEIQQLVIARAISGLRIE